MVAVQALDIAAEVALPPAALAYGFANEPVGTHISRTMMLADLRRLLSACPPEADLAAYYAAVVDENVLLKATVTTRRQSFRRLKELYRLDRTLLLFRALRDLWDADPAAQPLLALLCATATDPLLRCTADLLLGLPIEAEVTPQQFEAVVKATFPERYSPASLASLGRNVASSWQQSGHLRGKLHKFRVHAACRPPALVYALLLGSLQQVQGEALFTTRWCRLLDTPGHVLHSHAVAASQRGWIEYRRAGSVTEVGFRYLLRSDA